jgi:hypothetical protein
MLSFITVSTQGFFSIFPNLFARLATEETWFSEEDVSYPSFGRADWPWILSSQQSDVTPVKNFYTVWMNFSTAKDFSWCDKWNLGDAPDRRARRQVEHFEVSSSFTNVGQGLWKRKTKRSAMIPGESTMIP